MFRTPTEPERSPAITPPAAALNAGRWLQARPALLLTITFVALWGGMTILTYMLS